MPPDEVGEDGGRGNVDPCVLQNSTGRGRKRGKGGGGRRGQGGGGGEEIGKRRDREEEDRIVCNYMTVLTHKHTYIGRT